MSSFFSLEVKKFFFNNISDIIIILLFLVAILFLIFSIMHLLRKRKSLIDDTVPYLVYLKETLDELIKEADELKKELTSAKASTPGITGNTDSHAGELSSLQTLVDEKSHEISKLKDEIKKYDILEKDRKKAEPKTADNSAELNAIKEENTKLKAQLKETEQQAASGTVNSVDLENMKDENSKLKIRLGSLETKIAEYEIIEDDLANLKILKEENEKLKGQIEELHSVVGVNADEPKAPEKPVVAESAKASASPSQSNDQLQAEIDNVLQQFDTEMQKEATPNDKAKKEEPSAPVAAAVAAPVAVAEESVDPELLKEFGLDPNDISATPVPAPVAPAPSVEAAPVAVSATAPVVAEPVPAAAPVPAPAASPVKEEVKEEKKELVGDNIEGKLAEEFEKFMAENH